MIFTIDLELPHFFLVSASMTENLYTGLQIPFVALRTPSDESNRSSSFTSSLSKPISTSNSRSIVRKSMKTFFSTSKTTDNMSNVLHNGNHLLTTLSKYPGNFLKLKPSTRLSHSQPIVNENLHYLHHTEQTPLIQRRKLSELSDTSPIHQQELHLPNDIDSLPRSRSCTEGGILPSANQDLDSPNPVISVLQPNSSEVGSLRSSDSTVSSLSAYMSTPQQLGIQLNNKNDLNKSQDSIFSFSSPAQKQRSIKSLIRSVATNDKATKQDNDVLVLIASWVLRSPEDFQGIKFTSIDFFNYYFSRSSRSKRIKKFFYSIGIITKFISNLDKSN